MVSIYEKMKSDWKTYSLMCGIALIEEMSKPTLEIQNKIYKSKIKKYKCYRRISFKLKDFSLIQKWWSITKFWEDKLKINFLGNTFKNGPKQEKSSEQWYFILSPLWLFHVLKKVGNIPSKYTFNICIERLSSLTRKRSGSKYFIPKEDVENIKNFTLYNKLLYDKVLASGAFLISLDLEFRGVSVGNCRLTMTIKYKDFLKFMLKIARKWEWTNNVKLFDVNINSSIRMGIKATPKKEFGLSMNSLKDIYKNAGPLGDLNKNKFLEFHIKRTERYNRFNKKSRKTVKKILSYVKENKSVKAVDLQFITGVRVDVVLDHLHNLEKQGLVEKIRYGKGYFWNYKG